MNKCKIQWIDSNGNPTPDDNDAIGVATCVFNTRGEIEKQSYPICAAHYERMRNEKLETESYSRSVPDFKSHWEFEPYVKV